MSFKVLIISTLYHQYLEKYYKNNPNIQFKNYQEQYQHLVNDSSDIIFSYANSFKQKGIETNCIISNAKILQQTWSKENNRADDSQGNIVFEQIKKYKPDVVWIEDLNYLVENFISAIRINIPEIKLIFAFHCSPYNNKDLSNFKKLDFIITCTPGFKEKFEEQGLTTYLVYHAFDPQILDRIPSLETEKPGKFIFTGSLFLGSGLHIKRTELIEKIIKQNIDIQIYGTLEKYYSVAIKKAIYKSYKLLQKIKCESIANRISLLHKFKNYGDEPFSYYSKQLISASKPPVFGIDMLKLLKSSMLNLNIHGEIAGNYAGNVRLFEATGVGTCLLTDNKKNMTDLFDIAKEVVIFENDNDCIEKIKYLLSNPEECRKIAIAGQKRTLKDHTVDKRCELIITILKTELMKKS